jgi:glycosyltransferase involved in cell wall biosynthesis
MATSISVIVPTYKSARYVREAIVSIISQTTLPREIIVVDDASPDDTVAIVSELAKQSPLPIQIIQRDTNSGGPVAPMNVGVQAAQGELIAMLDHDDRMDSKRLALGQQLLEQDSQIGIAFGQSQAMNAAGELAPARPEAYARFGKTARVFSSAEAISALVEQGYGYGGAGGMMFRKQAWQSVQGFREKFRISWDYDFSVRVVMEGWKVGYIPEILYHHRIHQGNLEATGGGLDLYQEVAELMGDLANDARLSAVDRVQIPLLLARRALTAAVQQRELGNYEVALMLYHQARMQGAPRVQVLKGVAKTKWLQFRRKFDN